MANKKNLFNPVPRHVGIIMDGNGRWAKQRNLSRAEGHRAGAEVIEPVADCAIQLGIKALSLYALSVENIKIRPVSEIKALWELLEHFFLTRLDTIKGKNIQIRHSGSLSKIPGSTRNVIRKSIDETSTCTGLILNFCVNYGGRQEIIQAVESWLSLGKTGAKLTEKKLEKNLYTSGMPELDLVIRTSGEYRISNFFLWQSAYAELIFTDALWPDFRPENLVNAVKEYQKRERRYGGI